ncbi:MAG: TlpA family protein disulfide reductase [Gammaproteobacteria bacterium]|nr:TlpA family protein disulfide reductase [Gammaproteobacteria bacterium]
MQPVSFEQWQTIRAATIPAILVVDLWASWCVPCLERFPEMIRMSREYRNQGVEFVSLSLDDRDDPEGIAFANEFLHKNKPPFANYFLDEDIIDGFEKIGILGIPTVDIYARDGTRAYRLTGDNPNAQFTEEDVENALTTLLAR